MKKLCLFLTLAVISIGCEGEVVHYPDDDCVDWQIQVSSDQKIRLLDRDGNWLENIDEDYLRLFSTDKEWNYLLHNGEPESFQAMRAFIEIEPESQLKYIQLFMGQSYKGKEIDEKKGYFLLRINENTYHQIVAEYYTDCGDFILTKFHYNGTEYTANDWEIINVVVD